MILFLYFFCLFFFPFLLGNNVVVGRVHVWSWLCVVCCLLCELGTSPPPQGAWFVGRAAVRARHTAVSDPPH